MNELEFIEVEQKFVVDESFDPQAFGRRLTALGPERTTTQRVRDVYYLMAGEPEYVYRHRFDRELQHLSVKSLGGDTQVRLEVNLDLGQHKGDQKDAVERFLGVREIAWTGTLVKDIEVYYFVDCEVVYYEARAGERSLRCVEFEAVSQKSLDDAMRVIRGYREETGFGDATREKRPLVELMFPALGHAWR